MVASQTQNPIEQFQAPFKELENGFKLWLSKQSLAIEAAVETAVVTTTNAAQGVVIGAFMGTLTADAPSAFLTSTPFSTLRPWPLLNKLGFCSGWRSFCSGSEFCCHDGSEWWNFLCFEKVEGQGRCPVQIGQKFSQPPVEDDHYVKTRHMLNNLGLLSYEKNFNTLRDVRIPPGPRLLILDHIQRDLDPKEKRRSRN
ncbi:hypothetical protein VNO80_18408 [Phaseolus coccineus]|uniref:SAM domain-containing protein n=1 Tax=Phaseolus coccineus TaxID=3886 RepID=A0AAN9MFB1_PHACN